MKLTLITAVLSASAFFVALPAAAQVGSTTEIITGTVTGPDGKPIAGARVEVMSIELQTTRGRTTNEKGQYTLLFPDGGGQYRVTVKAIGMTAHVFNITRQSDEDRLIADARLSPSTQRLGQVVVQARQAPPTTDRATPGSQERNLTGEQLYRLPVDPTDIAAVAGLAPGVVTLGATDSSASAFSVAGQRTDQNQITLDGLSFGTGSVPSEAVRNTRVITNTYDVARGQFTGGQVASTTRGGTNQVQGSLGYVMNEPDLQFPDSSSTTFGQRYTQNQLSFGLGGPFAQDKAFWFASAQWRVRSDGLQSLLNANDQILQRYSVSPDSAQRFLGVLDRFGVPASTALVPAGRNTDVLTALSREDFVIGDHHTLTVRGDWNWQQQDATRMSALSVPAHGGDLKSLGGGALASLSSQFDNGIINEMRVYASRSDNTQQPFVVLPEGRVRVSSVLTDGSTGISSLSFGGNGGLPTETSAKQLEFSNEVSLFRAGSAHRVKLGVLLNISAFDNTQSANQYGAFTFNSLADFDANLPSQFTRTLEPTRRQGDATSGAVYLGDTWRVSRAFQTTFGVRLEGTRFDGRPQYNPAVDALFGRRTDNFPSETHASPRFGFTWTSNVPAPRQPGDTARGAQGGGFGGGDRGGRGGFGGRGGGGGGANLFAGLVSTIVRGGIGEFRGRAPTGLFTSALGATGLAGTESQLVCIGGATPVPDWSSYLANSSSIPDKCADGGNAAPAIFAAQRPNVTTFAPDFAAPRSWRASLGVQHRLFGRYTGSLDATYSLGTNLYGVTDMNLNATPQFRLADEGNRPVYVTPAAIITTTGAVQSLSSRVAPQFGSVFGVFSGLRSDTRQLVASVNGFNSLGMAVSMSYTFSMSRDQSSFSGGSAAQGFGSPTTDGDPNVRRWARSDLERRHTIVGTATWPVTPSWELTGVMRFTSGQPYTPRIAGDINGDGARNDRAFIFDPKAAPDTALANGMSRLIANSPSRIRECLTSQVGHVADRNSCTAGWYPSLSLQVNYRPDHFGLKRNLMISGSMTNPLAGLDLLSHGSNNLQGWGQPNRVDPNLLYVTGFDPLSNRFRYQVNERFGDQRAATSAVVLQPFQLSVTFRYTVGPDRQREMLLVAQRMARGGRDSTGAPAAPGDMSGMVRRYAPNVFAQLIQMKDTLALTTEQVVKLTAMSDSLGVKIDTLAAHLQERVKKIGNNADPAAAMATLRPVLAEAQELGARSISQAQTVLTKDQWAKVPERIKAPRQIFGPGGVRPPRP